MTLFNGLPWSGVPLGSLSCLAGCALVLALIFDFSGLRRIDGPLLARYTNLWRLYKTYQGDMHHVYINLHHKYGNVVRIGPKCVSLAGIDAKSAIYGVSGPKFPKVSLEIYPEDMLATSGTNKKVRFLQALSSLHCRQAVPKSVQHYRRAFSRFDQETSNPGIRVGHSTGVRIVRRYHNREPIVPDEQALRYF